MNKNLTSLALVALGVQVAFSQGQVNFANTATTFTDGIDRFVYVNAVGGTKLIGTNYAAAIYWSKGTDPLYNYAVRALDNTALAVSVALFRNVTPDSTLAGTWSGGARYFVGADVGETLNLQIRIWDIQKFQTYAAALAAGGGGSAYGQSDVFSYVVPAATDAAGLRLTNFRAFAFSGPIIPEPSTVTLGVLGSGILLLSCRKRAFSHKNS